VGAIGELPRLRRRILVYLGDRQLRTEDGIDVWPLDRFAAAWQAMHSGRERSLPWAALGTAGRTLQDRDDMNLASVSAKSGGVRVPGRADPPSQKIARRSEVPRAPRAH
jgi:hypothetical protein